MEIKLSEQQAKEILGEIRLVNTKERIDRETGELLQTVYNIGSPNLEGGTFAVRLEGNKPCNIKPFGLVKLVNPTYAPRAEGGTLPNGQTWTRIAENFNAEDVVPLDDSQKIADENGEAIDPKKSEANKEPVGAGSNKK